jgi:hypothetical protein
MCRSCENKIFSDAMIRVNIVKKANGVLGIGLSRLEEQRSRSRGKDIDRDSELFSQEKQEKVAPSRNPQMARGGKPQGKTMLAWFPLLE